MSFRSLLARATEGTDAPTPGYIYLDLSKAAAGNPGACQEMASYLTRRLASKQNPNIKFKCCKVLAKLCESVPRNAFRRCVAQDHAGMAAIKEAINFRGVPDAVRGDEPNRKVRTAAKECMDAVYREAPTSEVNHSAHTSHAVSASQSGGPAYGGISSSYGASPHASNGAGQPYSGGYSGGGGHSGTGYSPAGSQSRMQGIGNPRYSDPRHDPRYNGTNPTGIGSVMKEAGEVIVGMIKDPLARNMDVGGANHHAPPRQGHSGNLPGYGGPSYGRPPPGAAELSRQTQGEWTMASNRGPAAMQPNTNSYGGNNSNNSDHNSGTVGGSWGNVSSTIRPHNTTTPSVTINSGPGGGSGGTAVSDGTYEKNMVLELCPPGGMKPVPPPDKLASFARTCASLNSDLVCPTMLDCLEDGQPWIIRAKALCAMEAAIANGTKADGVNPYRDFFFACQDEIAPLASHARAAIHDPAKRVLALLGVDPAAATASAAAPLAAPNLLDFDEPAVQAPAQTPAQTPAPPPSQAPPVAPAGDGGSMFGGMQVKAATQTQPQPANETPPSQSLLDFGSATPVSAAAPVDIFAPGTDEKKDSNTPEAPPSTTTTAPTSMFGQLSVKDSTSEEKAPDVAAVPTGGSAFGFMNGGASAKEEAPPPSFDPLMGNGGSTPTSTQRKAMTISPEQMQAMAYQQMMMQQQMQMMAMQQRGGGLPMFPGIGGPGVPLQRIPSAGAPPASPGMSQFSFNTKPAKKDDKKFDFVQETMKSHKK